MVWGGAKAVEVLEEKGIRCNMTLLFSFIQAATAAQVGAALISRAWAASSAGTAAGPHRRHGLPRYATHHQWCLSAP